MSPNNKSKRVIWNETLFKSSLLQRNSESITQIYSIGSIFWNKITCPAWSLLNLNTTMHWRQINDVGSPTYLILLYHARANEHTGQIYGFCISLLKLLSYYQWFPQAKAGFCNMPHPTTLVKWYRSTSWGRWHSPVRLSPRSSTSYTWSTMFYTTGL